MPVMEGTILRVKTVPVWLNDEDEFVYGTDVWSAFGFEEPPEPVAWANIATVEIDGDSYELLMIYQEDVSDPAVE